MNHKTREKSKRNRSKPQCSFSIGKWGPRDHVPERATDFKNYGLLACSRTILAPSCQPNVCLVMSMIVAFHHLVNVGGPSGEGLISTVVDRAERDGLMERGPPAREISAMSIWMSANKLGENKNNWTAGWPRVAAGS